MGGNREGLVGCGQGRRRAGPLSKLGILLFGVQQSCPAREQRKVWTDLPCLSLSPVAGGGGSFRIKSHTQQRCLEGSNIPCMHQDRKTPQRLRQNCV